MRKLYLQYLTILLDDTSVSFCHADNPLTGHNLMPLDTLKKAILFGMKENLMIQFVYPKYDLSKEYEDVIESIDHVKIGQDILVVDSIKDIMESDNIVLRIKIQDFIKYQMDIIDKLPKLHRLNICFTNIDKFSDDMIAEYRNALENIAKNIAPLIINGKKIEINILTDRLKLTEMNNCGAGITNITVAPNGNFYICPAFYYDEKMKVNNHMNYLLKNSTRSVGNLDKGLNIPNKHLLSFEYAPICKLCDAFHCNRCIWLNQNLTMENNTPSHQQCVISHIERNTSMKLLKILKDGGMNIKNEIKEIDYLDPFDIRKEY